MRLRARLLLAPRLVAGLGRLVSVPFRWTKPALLLVGLALIVVASRPVLADHDTVLLRRGTTLAEVAASWKTTPETLRYLNHMEPRGVAWSGMTMKVPPKDGMIIHKVQPGETSSSIAAEYGMPLAQFMEYNRMSPIKRLRAGDMVFVASSEGILATQELPIHTVQKGETLASIAAAFGTTSKLLARINQHTNLDRLRPGTRLVIAEPSLHEKFSDAKRDANSYPLIELDDFPTLTEKWIDVDLSEQRVVAYEGTRPVRKFLISSGRSPTPTVTGVFRIRAKVASQRMSGGSIENGDYYNLPNVQWVSYFFGAYAFHGTYWHKNFGHPMSHGCINMTNDDAKWLYDWSGPQNPGTKWYDSTFDNMGTLVVVHY